jgi:glycosyltransferase involved in cell wall biosynthesis
LFPYAQYDASAWQDRLRDTISEHNIDTVFLNRAELGRLIPVISAIDKTVRCVLMSHGNESGDLVYEMAVHRKPKHRNLASRLYDYLWLGGDLTAEAQMRHEGNFTVIAMSEEEAVIERWLGANDVLVLPRTIVIDPLAWTPKVGRVGWVGSLNHTPNIAALRRVLDQITERDSNIQFDIIGRPQSIGEELATQYPCVRYLGALNEAELNTAMGKWMLFLNPIFWLSKGASMKLADALSRGLPTLSTRSGWRGYELPEGVLFSTEDDAVEFAERIDELLHNPDVLIAARSRIIEQAGQMTSVEALAHRLRMHLAHIRRSRASAPPISGDLPRR